MNRRRAFPTLCFFLLLAGGLLYRPARAQEAYTVTYRYDAQGRLTQASYDDAFTAQYTYDAAGNRTALAAAPDEPTPIEDAPDVPTRYALHGSYPNPFNPTATIPFDVKEAVHVRLAVYDVLGRQVAVLVDGPRAPGRYEAVFEAQRLASGVYLYRVEMGTFVKVRRMVLVK